MKKFIILSLISILSTNSLFSAALGRNVLNTGLKSATTNLLQVKAPARAFTGFNNQNHYGFHDILNGQVYHRIDQKKQNLFAMFDSVYANNYRRDGGALFIKKYRDSLKNDPATFAAFKDWEKFIKSDSQDEFYRKFEAEAKHLDDPELNAYMHTLNDREVVHFAHWYFFGRVENVAKTFTKYFVITSAIGIGGGYYMLKDKNPHAKFSKIKADKKKKE